MAKKIWEILQEQINQTEQSRQNDVKQANQQFNDYTSKHGTYDTSNHTTSIGNLRKASKDTPAYNNIVNSTNKVYRASVWEQMNNLLNKNNMQRDIEGNNINRKIYGQNINTNNNAMQNLQNAQQMIRTRNSADNYNKLMKQTQEDRIRNSVKYKLAKTRNPNATDEELLKLAQADYGQGNIDLNNRPIVRNEDGSISTVRSMSFQDENGQKVLIPTVVNGKVLSDDEAINHYYQTGEYLGKFDSVEDANEYAEKLHRKQADLYLGNPNDEINELANLPTAQAVNELKKMSTSDKNPLFYNNSKFRKLNNQLIQTRTEKQAEEQADEINQDLENGNIGSSIAHIAEALPTKTMEAVASPIYSTGSLLNLKLNNQTADQDLQDWKAVSSRYDQTNENINSGVVRDLSNATGTIGYMVPSILASVLMPGSSAGKVAQAVSVGSQGYMDNLNENATNKVQSAITGVLKGGASALTEGITGGDMLGKGSLDELAVNAISKAKNKGVQKLASLIYNIGGENIEELLENQLDHITDTVVNDKGITMREWLDEQKETVKGTTLSTLIMNMIGLGGNTYNDVKDAEAKKWINEAQKIIDKEKLSLDNIDPSKLNIKNNQAEVNQVLDTIQAENNILPTNQQQQLPANQNLLQNIQNKQTNIQDMQQNSNHFQYEKSDNERINNLRQDVSKYFDNSEQTHNFENMLEKIITDQQDQDLNIRIQDLGTDENGNIINGKYDNNTITINPNSDRAGEFIAVHELTHAIGTDQMVDMIDKYRKSNAEFDENIKKLIGTYDTKDINEEALADVSGQVLGNQEFINNLRQTNPNVFQKIYSEIKYLWHQFTGYKNQNQFVEDLYYKWTQAYNDMDHELNNSKNYSIETNSDGSKYVKVDTDQDIFSGIDPKDYTKVAKMYMQDYLRGNTQLSDNDNANIDSKGINKYTNPKQPKHYIDEKMKLTPELENALKIAQKDSQSLPTKDTSKYPSWEYYKFNFEIAGKPFEGTINIGVDKDGGKHFYEINKIHTTSLSSFSTNKSSSVNTTNNISHQNENVNTSTNPDIRYSKENSTWRDYLENNFKEEGTRTNLKDILPKKQNSQNNTSQVNYKDRLINEINNSYLNENQKKQYIKDLNEQVDYLDKDSYNQLKEIYKEESKLPENTSYKTDNNRRKAYITYKNDNSDYDFKPVQNAFDTIPTNRNGKRTINQWKQVAENIGVEVADKSNDEIEKIAFRSWNDLQPNTKENITRYDNVNHSNVPFQRFTSDDWVNTIYKSVNDVRNNNSIQVSNDLKESNTLRVNLPTKENTNQSINLPTRDENVNYNDMQNPNDNKIRKHYKSIIASDNTTAEAKKIAKQLMGTDTYVPETNKGQLTQADARIQSLTPDVALKSLMEDVIDGNKKITSVDIATGERLIQYYSKIGDKENLQNAIQATAMAGTTAGQTVQALSMLNHQTPEGQATWIQRSVDKMNNELARKKGGIITTDEDGNKIVINKNGKDITNKVDLFDLTPEMLEKIASSKNQNEMYDNIDAVYEELGQQVPLSTMEKIDSWRYFSMLANPRTHIRNIVGNVAMGQTQRFKDKLAGGIEDVVGLFDKDMERTKTLRLADKKTMEFAKKDVMDPDVQSRMELNENKYNPQSRLQNARRTFKSDALENTLGRLFNWNDKALSDEDALGLKSAYKKALTDYLTANKIDTDNITDTQLNKARNYAVQQAKEATFHQANAIATAINQFSRKNKLTKGVTDAILPFVKTPMNVAKTGIEYNPVGLLKTITLDTAKLRKGNITVNQYIDNLSKGLTGTGIAVLGYALADAGILKASGSDDDKKEKYDENLGKQSYAITIGNKTYSLDWLAPVGIPLFVGAEAFNVENAKGNEKSSKSTDDDNVINQKLQSLENLGNAMANSMSPMSEMSMISGLTSALKSYQQDSTQMLGQMGTNAVKSYVNQFVPTVLGQIAKTGDDYERSTTSTKTGLIPKAVDQTRLQMMSKIPGLRQKLPTKEDIWGNPQKTDDNIPTRLINNFINPATVKDINTSKVDEEISKVYDATGESSVLPTTIDKTFTINNQKYRMTNEEYSKYKEAYGQNAYKLLDGLVNSKDYKNLTDDQKKTAIENVYSYVKEQNKVDYAKSVKQEVKTSSLYNTLEDLKKNGQNQSTYLEYYVKTKDIKGEDANKKKMNLLENSNYTDKVKQVIYEDTLKSKEDFNYDVMKSAGININEILDYKQQEFKGDKEDDGTLSGKTVKGSKKDKTIDYLNTMDVTGKQRLLLYAMGGNSLSRSERDSVFNYVEGLDLDLKQREKLYNKFSGFTVYKNGTVKY